MSTIDPKILALVDQGIHERAFKAYQEAIAVEERLCARLAVAEKEAIAAVNASLAVNEMAKGNIDANFEEDEEKLRKLQFEIDSLNKAIPLASQRTIDAHNTLAAARGIAHQPIFDLGVEGRIKGGDKLAAAREAVAAAEREIAEADKLIRYAAAQGTKWPTHLSQGVTPTPRTGDEERKIWRRV